MFGFLKVLGLLIDVMPAVVKMIDVAESVIGPGKGATKLAMVKNTVQTAYTVSNEVESSFDVLWPVFETSIGYVVASKKQAAPVEQDPAPAAQVEQPAEQDPAPAAQVEQPAEHPYAPMSIDPSVIM